MSDPIFDPDKCPVPPLERLPLDHFILDCDIPAAPEPIHECAETTPPEPQLPPLDALTIIGGGGSGGGGGGGGGGGDVTIIRFVATADRAGSETTVAATAIAVLVGDLIPPGLGVGNTFTAHDPDRIYPLIIAGASGLAVWDIYTERYHILVCQQQAILARARINYGNGMNGDESEVVQISDFEVMSPSPFSLAPDPLPDTAVNVYRHRGPDGNYVQLTYDAEEQQWVITDVEKVQVPHIYDLRLADDGWIQVKTVDAAIETNKDIDSADNWTNKIDTDTCP